jgi:hypothetical protein
MRGILAIRGGGGEPLDLELIDSIAYVTRIGHL